MPPELLLTRHATGWVASLPSGSGVFYKAEGVVTDLPPDDVLKDLCLVALGAGCRVLLVNQQGGIVREIEPSDWLREHSSDSQLPRPI